MLCDKCKQREANIHVSRNINGTMYEQNLCSECAGIPEDIFSTFGSFGKMGGDGLDRLMSDLKEMSVIGAPAAARRINMQESDFEAMGLKLPDAAPAQPAVCELDALRDQLDCAVKAQEFERAAELRDKIYFMEKEQNKAEND